MAASPDGFYLGCHGCKKPIEVVIDDGSEECRFVADDVLQVHRANAAIEGITPQIRLSAFR